jgi:lipopolysaccharide biosynthesis glycosyltransferase
MIITCAIDNNYIRHCAVMLRSVYESNSKEEISVYIIHGDINASEKEKLATYLGQFLSSVSFIQIDPKLLQGLPVFGHITLSTYYRLLLPAVLPRDIPKAIFLDADIIVVGSLSELWNTDLGGHPMAAVTDHGLKSNCERLGLSLESGYFNAGVMLIDVNKWRARDILTPGLEFAKINQTRLNNWDQDIFNHLFEGQWLHLDAKWNAQPHIWDLYKGRADDGVPLVPHETAARDKPVIIHFAGGGTVKPWDYRCAHPWKARYLELKKKTPWAGVPLDSQPPPLPVRLWNRALFRLKCLAKEMLFQGK